MGNARHTTQSHRPGFHATIVALGYYLSRRCDDVLLSFFRPDAGAPTPDRYRGGNLYRRNQPPRSQGFSSQSRPPLRGRERLAMPQNAASTMLRSLVRLLKRRVIHEVAELCRLPARQSGPVTCLPVGLHRHSLHRDPPQRFLISNANISQNGRLHLG